MKFGAAFERIDPAGFRLLGSLDRITREVPYDLTITCGTEAHPASDPHTLGRAYDIRTHTLTDDQKRYVLRAVLLDLQEAPEDAPAETNGGLATARFFGWLEHQGQDGEHIHLQQRKGVSFP